MITPREFQWDMFNRVRAMRQAGKRIIVVQASTGAGKTTVGAMFVKACFERGKRSLWLVHRRKLVNQASRRFEQFGIGHAIFMQGDRPNMGASVQVASRDTLTSRCFDRVWIDLPPADLVLVDEAHHCTPESGYREILAQYPQATILLITATPVMPDGGGMGPWAQGMVCGPPTSKLIEDGYLCPVKHFAPDRKKKGNKFLRGICGDLVASWQQYAEGKPTVLFCSRVQHSLDAVEEFNRAGIPAAHVDADTKDRDRERIFEQSAEGRIKVVSNVGIVGEGVDVPEWSVVQWFCEVNGRTKWSQGNGRIMRPAPGKEYGICIDHTGSVFRHGFADEDFDWPLEGNADDAWESKKAAGETETAHYCKNCEMAYHGNPHCPGCGRMAVKPPKSIFAPDPVRSTSELLVEVDKTEVRESDQKERLRTWFACLTTAKKRNGSFGMAGLIYKNKYGSYPPDDFPMNHPYKKDKVADVYPDFGKKKESA